MEKKHRNPFEGRRRRRSSSGKFSWRNFWACSYGGVKVFGVLILFGGDEGKLEREISMEDEKVEGAL